MKHCSECKKAETTDNPAPFIGTAILLRDNWGKIERIPWKAHLCDGHCQVIANDLEIDGVPVENFKTKRA